MTNRWLALLLLAVAIFLSADASAECKKGAACKFYNEQIRPFYGNSWFVDPEGAVPFEYADLLEASDNSVFVSRLYLFQDGYNQARGRTGTFVDGFGAQQYKNWNELWTRYMDVRRSKKKFKKFAKKGTWTARAIDLIVEYKDVDGLPVMRAGVRPLNVSGTGTLLSNRIAMLRTYNTTRSDRNFVNTVHVPVRMPDLSDVQRGEIKFSDWQFCPSCVKTFLKTEGAPVFPHINPKTFLAERGQLPSESSFPWDTSSIYLSKTSSTGIYYGDAAIAMASTFRRDTLEAEQQMLARKQREADHAERYAEERATYDKLVAELRKGSLRSDVNRRCGELKLYDPPNPRQSGSHTGWYKDGAKKNASRYETHVRCVLESLEAFDYNQRAAELAAGRETLSTLFENGHYEFKTIAKFTSAKDEVDQLGKYLNEQEARYNKTVDRYARAWDELFEVFAERREKRIAKEVDKCLAGLAMTGSLTPSSGGYCRSMAEQGYTGLSAAAAGYNGGSRGTSSSTGSVGSFSHPTMPKFDLNGMIANAQAVADGADASLLWNSDGTVRKTIAPEAVAHQNRQRTVQPPADNRSVASLPAQAANTPSVSERMADVAVKAESASSQQAPASSPKAESTASTAAQASNGINITVNQTLNTPQQMAQLERGETPENLNIGWGGGSKNRPSTNGVSAGGMSTTTDSSSSASGSGGGGAAGTLNEPAQRKKKPTKYVWTETELRHRGWPTSTRARAEKDFKGTLSSNRFNEVCGKTYKGSSGYNGLVVTNIRSLDNPVEGWWHGVVEIRGYCRVFAHHESYASIPFCASESRGQLDCAVRERY